MKKVKTHKSLKYNKHTILDGFRLCNAIAHNIQKQILEIVNLIKLQCKFFFEMLKVKMLNCKRGFSIVSSVFRSLLFARVSANSTAPVFIKLEPAFNCMVLHTLTAA